MDNLQVQPSWWADIVYLRYEFFAVAGPITRNVLQVWHGGSASNPVYYHYYYYYYLSSLDCIRDIPMIWQWCDVKHILEHSWSLEF